jgi:hypothetical protein
MNDNNRGFHVNNRIRTLDLSQQGVRNAGVLTVLSAAMAELSVLTHISLQNNYIDSKGCIALTSFFNTLPVNMEYTRSKQITLDLRHNPDIAAWSLAELKKVQCVRVLERKIGHRHTTEGTSKLFMTANNNTNNTNNNTNNHDKNGYVPVAPATVLITVLVDPV